MIAVTGAAGKTGRAVLSALSDRGVATRALVRRPADLPATEVVVGDMAAGLAGVDTVYLIAPNVHPDEPGLVGALLAAAKANGVSKVVYHSVLHPHVEAMPHHWAKARAEELLYASGLDWTILQPCAYAQNLVGLAANGVLRVPYDVDALFAFVDLADVAEVAARVLTEPGHSYATYQLAGPELRSVADAAALLGGRAERQDPADWEAESPLAPYPRQALAAMFRYYDAYGLPGNARVLTGLLGRPGRRLAEVLGG